MPIVYNIFQNIVVKEILTKSFYEVSITLIPKSGKDFTEEEKYRPIFLINLDARSLSIILANQIQQCRKGIVCWVQVRYIQGMEDMKSINVQETGIKTIPTEKKCKKSKMAVWGGLTNSCEKKRSKKQRRV